MTVVTERVPARPDAGDRRDRPRAPDHPEPADVPGPDRLPGLPDDRPALRRARRPDADGGRVPAVRGSAVLRRADLEGHGDGGREAGGADRARPRVARAA